MKLRLVLKLSVTILFFSLHLTSGLLCLNPTTVKAQARAKSSGVRTEMLVTTDWLAKNLTNPKVIVLHVAREKAHYDAGHIPGARFLALGEMLTVRDGVQNELPPVSQLQQVFSNLGVGDDARVILYGENSGLLAARVYFTLDYLGHGDHAALLDGGLEKWKAEKRELSTAAPEVKAATFTPRVNPNVLVVREVVRDLSWEAANSNAATVALIDSRPADDYTGAKGGREGHLPGAGNVYWMEHFTNKDVPTMRPVTELRKMYEAAGVAPGQKVVTYCRSGMQASHGYFTAKYLGYDVTMYDGSFSDWIKNESLPVVTGKEKK